MSLDWIPTGPTRKIRANIQGNRGFFPTTKVPMGIIEYESCLERDAFLVFDHAPDVIFFQHQPVSIIYKDNQDMNRQYTPDVYVEFQSGVKFIFEIKYNAEAIEKSSFYEERWTKAREWCEKRGIQFSILTENEIRSPRWYNIWFTLGSSKENVKERDLSTLSTLIPTHGIEYEKLCHLLSETLSIPITKAAQILCYAIYHGLVFLDCFSTQRISNQAIIRKRKSKSDFPFCSLLEEIGVGGNIQTSTNDGKKDSELIIKKGMYNEIQSVIPENYQTLVNNRLTLVKLWLKRPKHLRCHDWRAEFCRNHKIHEKTLYRWIKSYQEKGIDGLIPHYHNSGRKPKYTGQVLDFMEKARNEFLKPLSTIAIAYERLEEYCRINCLELPPRPSFVKFIYDNTTAEENAKKRGMKFYKTAFTPSLASYQGAIMPMQVLQIDNTSCDVFPVDEATRQSLSTPFMTTAIDCYTKMITGVSVSFFPSSSQTVLEVLVQTILPKLDYTIQYETLQEWPIQGFPVVLLIDNGMDYRSNQVKEFCIKNNIIVEYAPIRTPRYKAFIEEWFNILHKALVSEEIPGLRPLLKQRLENPQLNPELSAILTLQELEHWLYKWIIDAYHFNNPYQGYAQAPFLNWHQFMAGQSKLIMPLPREPPKDNLEIEQLFLATLDKYERKLTYGGVIWEHLKYNSNTLAETYKILGSCVVKFYLNRRDIRWGWVITPNCPKPIKIGLSSGWAQALVKTHGNRPIQASAWIEDIHRLKERIRTKISPFQYEKEISKIQRSEIIHTAKKESKAARKRVEKEKEAYRKDGHSPLPVYDFHVNGAIEALQAIENETNGFRVPQPKDIVIPPRKSNPFVGITFEKAQELKNKKRY